MCSRVIQCPKSVTQKFKKSRSLDPCIQMRTDPGLVKGFICIGFYWKFVDLSHICCSFLSNLRNLLMSRLHTQQINGVLKKISLIQSLSIYLGKLNICRDIESKNSFYRGNPSQYILVYVTENKDREFDNFVVTVGHYDNLRCQQWRQNCQTDELLFLCVQSINILFVV